MSDKPRSAEYALLTLQIFAMSNDELHEQLERASMIIHEPEAIFEGDVTYVEWEFLLLTELEFRQAVGLHKCCEVCEENLSQLLAETT